MADVVTTTTTTAPVEEAAPARAPIVYTGSSNNLVPGAALLFAGILAFSMGMTDVFFAEAMAWTFAIWGVLLIYSGLLDINETYEITDDALIIRNVMRPWAPRKTFPWDRVNRLDVVVKRAEAREDDLVMQVYYNPEGELANERRDRTYDPALAELIVEYAGLRPADKDTPKDVARVPRKNKATYTWK
jgi:hypothetical protein